jgi:hypothetical protein
MRLRLLAPLAIIALGTTGCEVSGSIGGSVNTSNEAATNEAAPADAMAGNEAAATAPAAESGAMTEAAPAAEGDAPAAEGQ